MEGDRLITLVEPGQTETDRYGAEYKIDGVEHQIWARRFDRGGFGGRKHEVGIEYEQWTVRFEVRFAGLQDLNVKWKLIDERGVRHDIEGVAEVGKNRQWLIYAIARL